MMKRALTAQEKSQIMDALQGDHSSADTELEWLQGGGLTHDHLKLGESGPLLRIPRKNQLGLSAEDYIAQQAMIYRLCAPSGVTPALYGSIAPQSNDSDHILHQGACVIGFIHGRKMKQPSDYTALATSLAQMHQITPPVNSKTEGPELMGSETPFDSQIFLLNEIFKGSFEGSHLPVAMMTALQRNHDEILQRHDDAFNHSSVKNVYRPSLINGDNHIGNILIDDQGKAWLVDLEFTQYETPFIDLADAILPITSRLDPDMSLSANHQQRARFYKEWFDAMGHAPMMALYREQADTFIHFAEDIVALRTLAWLSQWVKDRNENAPHIHDIPQASIDNWDQMAQDYLYNDALTLTQSTTRKATARPPIFKP